MTISQFLLILRARYKAALLTLLITVALVGLVTFLMPSRYSATSSVLVDVKSPDPVAGMVLPGMGGTSYMATQVDVINSDRVSQRAVTLMGLDKNPETRATWVENTGGKGSFVAYLAEQISAGLTVQPGRDSNVISISYRSTNPEFAATAANAFARAYIETNLDLKVEPARQYAEWFQTQTKSSRDRLDEAQQALYAYQQKAGIVAADERLDFEVAKLSDTAAQLTAIQTANTDAQSKRAAGETVAEVMTSPLVNNLKSDIGRVEARLEESSGNLGSNHPQTLRTQAELASLKSQLTREIARINNSINTTYQVGKQRERELQNAIAAQKARVLEMNNRRNELSVLQGDVAAAQREFEAVSSRAAQSRLESLSNQTNLSTLTSATVPLKPSSPRVLFNMLAAVFVGTILGIFVALIIELLNRRVRSTADLVEFLEIPVLAAVASSKIGRAQQKLIASASRPALANRSAA